MLKEGLTGRVILPKEDLYAAPEDALILTILQDPGKSGAEESGGLGYTNKGGSADVLRKIYKEIDLDWKRTYTWNTIPWTDMSEDKDKELERVYEWGIISELVGMMK